MRWPFGCHVIAMRWPFGCHVIAMLWPFRCHVIAMLWPLSLPCLSCLSLMLAWRLPRRQATLRLKQLKRPRLICLSLKLAWRLGRRQACLRGGTAWRFLCPPPFPAALATCRRLFSARLGAFFGHRPFLRRRPRTGGFFRTSWRFLWPPPFPATPATCRRLFLRACACVFSGRRVAPRYCRRSCLRCRPRAGGFAAPSCAFVPGGVARHRPKFAIAFPCSAGHDPAAVARAFNLVAGGFRASRRSSHRFVGVSLQVKGQQTFSFELI